MNTNPFSMRDVLTYFLPKWFVKLLGPFPDEVGRWPVVAKWTAILFVWVWFANSLVAEQNKDAYAKVELVVGLIFFPIGVLAYRTLQKRLK